MRFPLKLVRRGGPALTGEIRPDARPLQIGRATSCDVVLADLAVSRRHARLRWQGAELVLHVLGCRNPVPACIAEQIGRGGQADLRHLEQPARMVGQEMRLGRLGGALTIDEMPVQRLYRKTMEGIVEIADSAWHLFVRRKQSIPANGK